MKRNKGIAEAGVLAILAAIVGTVATTGVFVASNSLQGGIVGGYSAMAAYSQMPHVKRDFRENKAVREFGITVEQAQSLSDYALLDLIRDDAPGSLNRVAWMEANPGWRLGG